VYPARDALGGRGLRLRDPAHRPLILALTLQRVLPLQRRSEPAHVLDVRLSLGCVYRGPPAGRPRTGPWLSESSILHANHIQSAENRRLYLALRWGLPARVLARPRAVSTEHLHDALRAVSGQDQLLAVTAALPGPAHGGEEGHGHGDGDHGGMGE